MPLRSEEFMFTSMKRRWDGCAVIVARYMGTLLYWSLWLLFWQNTQYVLYVAVNAQLSSRQLWIHTMLNNLMNTYPYLRSMGDSALESSALVDLGDQCQASDATEEAAGDLVEHGVLTLLSKYNRKL